jgi:hypothetical protein
MMNKTQKIAIKQLIAFIIDFILIVTPLVVFSSMGSLWGLNIFSFLWFFYIPFCEYYYNQTIGMRVVGTKIYGSRSGTISKLSFGAVARRQIARVSIVWGILGWIFLLFDKQLGDDYVIVYKDNHSTDISSHPIKSEFGFRFSFAVVAKVIAVLLVIQILIALVSFVVFDLLK